MREAVGTLKTTVISDETQNHVFEICREFDTDGEEVILLTLYPTLTEPNTFDLSSMHLMNHASDEGLQLQKVHFVFLFFFNFSNNRTIHPAFPFLRNKYSFSTFCKRFNSL